MNVELFIARGIYKQNKGKSYTKPIVKICIAAIALSLTIMVVAISILNGYKTEITNKITGFGSHLIINSFSDDDLLETKPMSKNQPFLATLKTIPNVKHVQQFANKPCIIKSKQEMEGIVAKGIGNDFDWNFFESNLIEGQRFKVVEDSVSNNIVISKFIADKLQLKVGNTIFLYFIQNPPRARKLTISGIYHTGLEEFDSKIMLVDIAHIQKLNNWDSTQISGFEVILNDVNKIDKTYEEVYELTGNEIDVKTIKQLQPQLFDWLALQNTSVGILLLIMLLVATINIISILLILTLEKTNLIGVLKAMGANNWQIRKVILYVSFFMLLRGLLIGNIIGTGLCLFQKYTGFFTLDQSVYYISQIPIHISISQLIIINIGTVLVALLALFIPSQLISKIDPIKAIKFS